MKKISLSLLTLLSLFSFFSCQKEQAVTEPKLIIRLVVDSTQVRLNNIGQPSTLPAGNAAQNPRFNKIAAHYLELAPDRFTALGSGEVVYRAKETTTGGANAIWFDSSLVKTPGENYLEIPLKDIAAGTYEWVRLSLSYQNYDITYYYSGQAITGTVASFVGFNNYIGSLKVKNQSININQNKTQGFWAFETLGLPVLQGQSAGTTVPNPLAGTSPIPPGSCVVTGAFANNNLVITGNETSDIIITMSLSTNQSFEWIDSNGNGLLDYSNNTLETVVDMGLRGLIARIGQ